MQKIKKITKTVAGSALLVGATLAGAASMGAAQDSGSSGDLGDYPAPFVDDEGNIDATVVVGESAKTADVVGGLNIAASLGNAATTSDTSAGTGSFGWSATNGVTLDTQNDALYFGENIDEVRQTLTEQQIPVLETQEVLTGDEEQDVEQYVYLGSTDTQFGETDDEDALHLNVPSDVDADKNSEDNLMMAQANFQEGVSFYSGDSDDPRNDDVYGQEIELFGTTYTVGDDSFSDQDGLVLYGATTETSVATGESTTLTVGDEEVEVSLTGVTDDGEAVLTVAGSSERLEEDESVEVNGEDVRVTQINNFGDSGPSDSVELSVGSEQLLLEHESEVQVGSDEDEVDGTYVRLEGNQLTGDVTSDDDVELSSINVGFGAEDSDEDYLTTGDTYENPVFGQLDFTFAGLNPDAASDDASGVGTVEFQTDGDDTATASWMSGEDSAEVEFAYEEDADDSFEQGDLQDGDGDSYVVTEGQEVTEDDYVVADAGDFSHMWEVTDIDRDTDESNTEIASGDEAEISLRDVTTGNTIEVELDAEDDAEGSEEGIDYVGDEVIDGQTYNFGLDGDATGDDTSNGGFYVTWDSGADVTGGGNDAGISVDTGDRVSVFPAIDTDSGAAVTFAEEQENVATADVNSANDPGDAVAERTLELPSTDSSSSETVTLEIYEDDADLPTGDYAGNDFAGHEDYTEDDQVYIRLANADAVGGSEYTWLDVQSPQGTSEPDDQTEFRAGETAYSLDVDVIDSNGDETTTGGQNVRLGFDLGVADDQSSLDQWNSGGSSDEESDTTASALTLQPEDDENNENGFLVTPGVDTSDNEVDVGGGDGSITYVGQGTYSETTLEDDDDTDAGYNTYGTYTEQNTDEQGSFTLNIPSGQAVVGAAVHGDDGSISAGSSDTTVTMPTYAGEGFPAESFAALDSEVDTPETDTILVGGPAVNGLVQQLADNNQTMTGSEYSEGDAMVQMVSEAFGDNDALVVAGYAAEDTRAASEYIANYGEHTEELSGQSQVMVSTGQ